MFWCGYGFLWLVLPTAAFRPESQFYIRGDCLAHNFGGSHFDVYLACRNDWKRMGLRRIKDVKERKRKDLGFPNPDASEMRPYQLALNLQKEFLPTF